MFTNPARALRSNGMAKASETYAGSARASLFSVGRNCSAVARAQRVGLLVDGEEYFRSFALAAQQARRTITVLAWDFNSATRLNFDGGAQEPPPLLGDFLNWLVRHRRGLEIFILDWDYPLVFGTDREFRPLYGFGWRPQRHVHLAYDDTHPFSASHHQKIVVIDDSIAFIGGLDLTARRWDTCAHQPADARRMYESSPYPPFHDVMMAIDGEAARALATITRERWFAATGHHLPPAASQEARWPEGLRVDLTDVDVAFARTMPETPQCPPVVEVETLYLDMIAAARRHIYMESQYFTASRICDALEARLAEPDGPEIVVVVRLFSHGWLEENTMHVLRTRLVHHLRAADRHGRFHIFYPHMEGLAEKICIDLHSKVMIVDDDILRVGSANLSNRSMGMDSECDAVIEARGDQRVAAAIRGFRNRLLGEHLDIAPAAVDAAMRSCGTLHGAIDALAGRDRTLRPLEKQPDWPQTVVELAAVGDPDGPVSLDRLIEELSPEQLIAAEEEARRPPPRQRLRSGLLRVGLAVLVIAALAGIWRYTPLANWVNADLISKIADEFASRRWAPLAIMLAYTPACLVLFPRALITLAAVVAFGPQLGGLYALTGILLAALLTYLAGVRMPHHTIRSFTGQRLLDFAKLLRRRSLVWVTALRLVPIAPFSVESIVAGAVRIPLAPFMLGTLIGVLPGTLATTVFGDQLEAALRDPSQVNYWLLAAVVAAVVLLSLIVRRWLVAQQRQIHHGHDGDRAR